MNHGKYNGNVFATDFTDGHGLPNYEGNAICVLRFVAGNP
jgi:hypothetical protein